MSLEEFKKETDQPTTVVDYNGTLFSDYDYNVALVVNTASECGFTKQYKQLQELYEKYKDLGLVVIAQPSNQFGAQEPGTDDQIKQFCSSNFGVTFPILPKADVKGENATQEFKELFNATGQKPKWNFHKYLICKKNNSIHSMSHFTNIDEKFHEIIEQNL